jgi:hypothetical protein
MDSQVKFFGKGLEIKNFSTKVFVTSLQLALKSGFHYNMFLPISIFSGFIIGIFVINEAGGTRNVF